MFINTNSIVDFISYVYHGQDPENQYQYISNQPEEFYEDNPLDLIIELRRFLFDKVYNGYPKKSEVFGFLDFHKMKFQGESIDFYEFVKFLHRYTLMKGSNSCIKFTIPGDEKRLKEWRKSRKKMEVDTHISKSESTNVVIEAAASQVIELRNDVEETAGTEEQTSKEFDNRIDYKWSKEVVKDYFIKKFVQTKDKDGQSYFSEDEVMQLLQANFVNFFPVTNIVKLTSKASKAQIHIRRTFKEFYDKNTEGNLKKRKYCELLRDNFTEFDNSDFEKTIVSNFSRK